ncbi:MAG TPA: hypothetical protein VMU87_14205 [Stellaceae bacterium]|nr:hypothetical protein [Stellaceae bacterium]
MPVGASLLTLIGALALRFWVGAMPEAHGGTDRCFHVAFIRMIRQSQRMGSIRDDRLLLPGSFSYPKLYHQFISFLPEAAVFYLDRWSGLLFDAMVGAALLPLLARHGVPENDLAAILAFYLIAPGLTLVHIGPRAFALTPRSFSQLLAGLLIILYLANADGILPLSSWLWAGLATVLVAALLLSSKFAAQVLLLYLPTLTLLTHDGTFLAIVATGVATAWIASRGYFADQVAAQIAHLAWYRRNVSILKGMRGDLGSLWRALKRRDALAVAKEVLARNPILSGLARHFLLVPGVILGLSTTRVDLPLQAALNVSLASIAAWLLTSVGAFRILGEAERYLEFGFPAQWYLFFAVLPSRLIGVILIMLLGIHAAVFALNVYSLRQQFADQTASARRAVARRIDAFAQARLLVINDSESYCFYLETRAAICTLPNPLSPGELGWRFIDRLYAPYPYVAPEIIPELCRTYALNLAVLRKIAARPSFGPQRYQFDAWKAVYENEHYVLYEIPAVADAHRTTAA